VGSPCHPSSPQRPGPGRPPPHEICGTAGTSLPRRGDKTPLRPPQPFMLATYCSVPLCPPKADAAIGEESSAVVYQSLSSLSRPRFCACVSGRASRTELGPRCRGRVVGDLGICRRSAKSSVGPPCAVARGVHPAIASMTPSPKFVVVPISFCGYQK
jgi:hypothetical protein